LQVFEAGSRVGGLAAGFKADHWDWTLEKFYHHWFQSDATMLGLIDELGVRELLAAPLVALVTRAVGPGPRERVGLRYLRQSVVEAPALAIEQGRLEVLNMTAIPADALRLTRQLFADVHTPQSELRRSILDREKATDVAQHELTVFLSRVLTGALSAAQSEEWRPGARRRLLRTPSRGLFHPCHRLAPHANRTIGGSGVGPTARPRPRAM
jgi:hypothetical protein